MKKPAANSDSFPWSANLKADIGEDPARYLAVDRVDDLHLARARIRGIDYIAVLRAWRAVERRLAGRDTVHEWLDEREAELEEIGDRDERIADQDIEARREATPSTESVVDFPDRDGTYPFTNSVDADRYRAVAADGGESE